MMIITIDGPAGAGKSTVAKKLAERLDFLYVDTGAMYRALTLKVMRGGVDFSNIPEIVALARKTKIRLQASALGQSLVTLDNEDVSAAIRDPQVTNAVFNIARVPEIREVMVGWQREYGLSNNIVMEGRDIGTVVFPQAEKKFYLDASVEIRARRRYDELKEKKVTITLIEIIQQIKERDYKDKTRDCGPLKMADDALYVDSSELTVEEVVGIMLNWVNHEKKK